MKRRVLLFWGSFSCRSSKGTFTRFLVQDFNNQHLFQTPAAEIKCRIVVCVRRVCGVGSGLFLGHFCEPREAVLTLTARCVCVPGGRVHRFTACCFPLVCNERAHKEDPARHSHRQRAKTQKQKPLQTSCRRRRRVNTMPSWPKAVIE